MKTRSLLLSLSLSVAATIAACSSDGGNAVPPPVIEAAEAGAPSPERDAQAPLGLCVNGKATADYPPGPYAVAEGAVLPADLAWEAAAGAVHVKDYFEPCAAQSRLLVVRSGAAWCGPCLWHATHTTRLFGDARFAGRLRLLDLLIADEDNMPATLPAAARFTARIDVPAGLDWKIAIDAKYTLSPALAQRAPLPEYVIVDTRTMKVLSVLPTPPPEALLGAFAAQLALLDHVPVPPLVPPALHDGLLSDDQWDLLQGMTLPAAPPADPTNEYADVPAAAALGKELFSDVALSPSGTVACVTCHSPSNAFGDGLPQSIGVSKGDRNAPSIALSAHARWLFWDGRADTLWMQALQPPENPKEMASSRLFIAQQIAARYATEYGAVFGAEYPLPDLTALPASGKPGDPSYDALSKAQRDDVTRVYVNVGKAIAAFERTFRVEQSDLDRYAGGDSSILGPAQRRGLVAFFKVGCAQCHWGPRMTDDAFHALRFPTGRQDGLPDPGRADVLLGLAGAELVATSKWSDAPQAAKALAFASVPPSMIGAFKTPTLRGVTQSAPYGHGGSLRLLSDVAKHYGMRGQQVTTAEASGVVEEWVPMFPADVQADVPTLLDLLTAEPTGP